MEELKSRFPEGLEYRIVYDTTVFVDESIHEVYKTLIEAFILVFLVVLVFLQNWRATIIPMVAVPVSLIGTFALMAGLGFSLNNLSLFGLVLAIGIVVDDAIVVVESVELNMAAGLNPKEATRKSMKEVSGALIAIALIVDSLRRPAQKKIKAVALSLILGMAGNEPESVETDARAYLRRTDDGYEIHKIELETVGTVPGLGEDEFKRHAETAKQHCPVSRALAGGPEITLAATLAG